jgi:hypothetical protein
MGFERAPLERQCEGVCVRVCVCVPARGARVRILSTRGKIVFKDGVARPAQRDVVTRGAILGARRARREQEKDQPMRLAHAGWWWQAPAPNTQFNAATVHNECGGGRRCPRAAAGENVLPITTS